MTIGTRFNRLTVYGQKKQYGRIYLYCLCDCGNFKYIRSDHVIKNRTKSCGCYNSEVASKRIIKRCTVHGLSGTKAYRSWQKMLERCYNKNVENYHRYGGRGIKVNKRWKYFENFIKDMGQPKKGETLERLDNDKDYSPDNCIWADRKIQANNRSTSIKIEFEGVKYSIEQLAKKFNIKYATILARFRKNKSIDEILFIGSLKHYNKGE